ncbi:MAG: D-alanine transaminase [Candidatus Azotimanducaceae bacterium]
MWRPRSGIITTKDFGTQEREVNVPIAYLNGEWLPVEEAKISVLDRGFLFGDGVYEVIPVYNGKPFCLDRHVARLNASLTEIRLAEAVADVDWVELLQESVDKSGEGMAAIYIQVTRGADSVRNFVYPTDPTPTIFIMVNPAPQLGHREIKPLQLVTLEDFRWDRGHIKTISLIAAGMLKNEAIAAGANDAVLVKNGEVTEATSSNLFAVIGGVIVTPPKSTRLLHGITRDVVVELAKANGLPIEERVLLPEELAIADEIFISSSTMETWPVDRLDGKTIGNGEPGLVWQKVDALFQAHKNL